MNKAVRGIPVLLQSWGTLTHKTKPKPSKQKPLKTRDLEKFWGFFPPHQNYIIDAWQQETVTTVAQQGTIARN